MSSTPETTSRTSARARIGSTAHSVGQRAGLQPTLDRPSTGLLLGGLVLAACVLWVSFSVVARLVPTWISNPDYSHGFLVPAFAAFLLWARRRDRPLQLPQRLHPAEFLAGLLLMLVAGAFALAGAYLHVLAVEAFSLLPLILGVAVLCGGRQMARWVLQPVIFLAFMIPIPSIVAGVTSSSLQRIATAGSTYALQTIGIPAVAHGNIIWLSESRIGVAEACSGLPMLISFCALSLAACFLVRRPLWEKAVVLFSALLIAVIANVVRITATGLAFEYADERFANMIFHDLAGWLMMPLAVFLLAAELWLLSKLFLRVDSEEFLSKALYAAQKPRDASVTA